jgi:hypothetical protein
VLYSLIELEGIMKETKKVTLEQGTPDDYKRIVLEQGVDDGLDTTTPQWNTMKIGVKESVAGNLTAFWKSFSGALVPTFIFGVCFILFLFLVCGR